eukprot:1738513-Amphidinium_carterae.1
MWTVDTDATRAGAILTLHLGGLGIGTCNKDRARPPFWKFVSGLTILPYYRSPWDRPFGTDDWPQ